MFFSFFYQSGDSVSFNFFVENNKLQVDPLTLSGFVAGYLVAFGLCFADFAFVAFWEAVVLHLRLDLVANCELLAAETGVLAEQFGLFCFEKVSSLVQREIGVLELLDYLIYVVCFGAKKPHTVNHSFRLAGFRKKLFLFFAFHYLIYYH